MTLKTNHTLEVRDLEIEMSRVLDAPRELVWKTFTQPEHIENWWGPRNMTTKVHQLDMQVGGSWRFENISPDGSSLIFKGKYLDIQAPEKVVQTFAVEGMFEGQEIIETLRLEDLGSQTRVTTISRFDSNEARDGMLATGMEKGASESYERLGELLESLK